MIDLQPFCSTEHSRYYLHKPFSRGEYTYASNGLIMIRVPRLPDVGEIDKAIAAEKVFEEYAALLFEPAPAIELPEMRETIEKDTCDVCDGTGKEHECPDCDCECRSCDGTGEVVNETIVSVGIKGAIFHRKYLAMIVVLPGLEFGPIDKKKALHFRFDGGEGLIMPRSCKADDHFEIIPS